MEALEQKIRVTNFFEDSNVCKMLEGSPIWQKSTVRPKAFCRGTGLQMTGFRVICCAIGDISLQDGEHTIGIRSRLARFRQKNLPNRNRYRRRACRSSWKASKESTNTHKPSIPWQHVILIHRQNECTGATS